jgi:hypothetical protein
MMGVEKRQVAKGGKYNFIIFRKGGINIVLGPKCRPLGLVPSDSGPR